MGHGAINIFKMGKKDMTDEDGKDRKFQKKRTFFFQLMISVKTEKSN